MSQDKYTLKTLYSSFHIREVTYLYTNGRQIATFTDKSTHKTDAQKICDLLNETSRAQGKYK